MTEIAIPYRPRAEASREVKAALGRRYPTRVSRQLALAHALEKRVRSGEFADYAEMARSFGLSRARVTQLMDLLLLAPVIQEEILFLECLPGRQPISERELRQRVLRSLDWQQQQQAWTETKNGFSP